MTRVGIDLRAIQIGHQYRGIGEVVRQVTKYATLDLIKQGGEVVFFQYPDRKSKADALFDKKAPGQTITLPKSRKGRLTKYLDEGLTEQQQQIIKKSCDVFVQFDFELGLPKNHHNIVIIHDQIPYLLGNKYPHSYLADYKAGRRVGLTRKDSLKKDLQRRNYRKQLVSVLNRASTIITVSDYTAKTTRQFLRSDKKMVTMHLGQSVKLATNGDVPRPTPIEIAMNKELGLKKGNFVFFLGGVDERRRVDELIFAYNQVRSEGIDLHLVLVGYDFQSIKTVYSPSTRRAITSSSYNDQIHLLGYISDGEKAWLYDHALAFIFPTQFEGFGIMLVESLSVGCPVITYSNSSLVELAGPNTHLVRDWYEISDAIKDIRTMPTDERHILSASGIEWANKFKWQASAAILVSEIRELSQG